MAEHDDRYHQLARQIEEDFLVSTFGRNPKIVFYGRQLLLSGNKAASTELSRTIALLGDDFDADIIINRIRSKYSHAPIPLWTVRLAAIRFMNTHSANDANHLIQTLGGQLFQKVEGLWGVYVHLPCCPSRARHEIVHYFQFDNEDEMLQWLATQIAAHLVKEDVTDFDVKCVFQQASHRCHKSF